MELCIKMDTSQYYSGINSDTNDNDLANFYCQQHDQLQQQQCNINPPQSEFEPSDNQWDQAISCKQELDTYLNYSNSEGSNTDYNSFCNDSINEYEEKNIPQIQPFNPALQPYRNINNKRPYQITSTVAPLPTWYHPPNVAYKPQPIANPQFQNVRHCNNPQSQYPPYQQHYNNPAYMPSSTATTSAVVAPSIPPEHMMNMIHLTNR
jgi:hypothetical protein